MRPEPALTLDAHADVLQAADYNNTQSPGLGFDFLDEFEDTISLIREADLHQDPQVVRIISARRATRNEQTLFRSYIRRLT